MRPLTISRNSLFLRFFLWVWEANPERLNICKLFWGTILFFLAFMQFKKAYRFIPRITFFYLVCAVLFAALGGWTAAVIQFFLGVGLAICGYIIITRKSQSVEERRKEKGHILSVITERGSAVIEWILDHTIGLVIDLSSDVSDSRVGKCMGGFFSLIAEYLRAAKQHLCPSVRVV